MMGADRISKFLQLNAEQAAILRPGLKAAVGACAGSGKTRAIIAKYLKILEDSEADFHQIVTVTFTENAASELKFRISSKIDEYISKHGHRGNIAPGWRRKFFSAPIGTIHSFCAKILRENLLDSELALKVSVLDSREKKDFYEETIGRFFREELKNGDRELERLFEIESYDYGQIVNVTKMILEEATRLHMVPPFDSYYGNISDSIKPDSLELERMNETLRAAISEHVSTLTNSSVKKKDALNDLCEKIDLTLGISRNLHHMKAVYKNIKKQPYKKDPVEESRLKLQETFFSIMKHSDSEMNSLYLSFSKKVNKILVEAKRSEGKIEYEDMIRFTRNFLKEKPEILNYYRRFLKFIIVDEFQDTDGLQWELMNMLTDGGSKGSLVVVGDVNQSIYGFRGAQPEIFGNVLKRPDFTRVSFATNYRSREGLLEFFNAFFDGMFPEGHYEDMKHPSGEADSGPCVETIGCIGDNMKDMLAKEARAVVAKIKKVQKEHQGDIALLFRRSTHVSVYEKELSRAGIRFQSQIGGDFYALPEVRDVLCMLRYFLDPEDSLAEAAVLRSPYFGAPDDDLFSHFSEKGVGKEARIRNYLEFLGEKREEYVNGDPFRAVDFAVNGLGYSSAVLGLPDGGTRRLNLKKLLLIAERLVSQKGYGLHQVVEHIDSLRDISNEEKVFEEPEDEKVVRLMTVHGAKGLEFDTVFLCDTNYSPPSIRDRVKADIDVGLIVRYQALSSEAWEELKSQADAKESREGKRLLYVAMTRAKKRLFLCLSSKPPSKSNKGKIELKKNSFAKIIDSRLAIKDRLLRGEDDEFPFNGCSVLFSGEAESVDLPDTCEDVVASDKETPEINLKYLEPLYRKQDPSERKMLSRLPDMHSPIDRVKDPERVGSIMHRFLEVWDFRPETVEREMDFVLGEFFVSNPDIRSLLEELSSNFLESDLFPLVRDAYGVERELKFVVSPDRNIPKRGRIDLLTEHEDGVRLFDYKYRKSMNEAAYESYGEQMDDYDEAVRSRFEKPLLSRHIVLIPSVELVSI